MKPDRKTDGPWELDGYSDVYKQNIITPRILLWDKFF